MSGKEFWRSMAKNFFVVVTLINLATCVLGMAFRPEQTFGYDAFLSPILYGALSMLPSFIMYSKRELSVKEILIRKVLQFLFIEGILVFAGFGFDSINSGSIRQVAGFCLSVLVIYMLTIWLDWILDGREARKLTDDLRRYQEMN